MNPGKPSISWEQNTASPIALKKSGKYGLQFYVFYKCYGEVTDCDLAQDAIRVYFKLNTSDIYKILEVFHFNGTNSSQTGWIKKDLNLTELDLKDDRDLFVSLFLTLIFLIKLIISFDLCVKTQSFNS